MGEKLKKSPAEKEVRKIERKVAKKLKRRLKRIRNNEGHVKTHVATTSYPKLDGMSQQYSKHNFPAVAFGLDNYGYKEPDAPVVQTVESKAFAALILFGLARAEDFAEESLHFERKDAREVEKVSEGKDVLFDVMDAATIINGVSILKLIRDHEDHKEYSDEKRKQVLDEDKKKMEEFYHSDFQVVFEGGRGVLSSKGKIANAIAIRYIVDFKAIPQELIDEAYAHPRVWNIGPRVNLALLVSEHPELIKEVHGEDMHDPEHKRVKLEPKEYHRVGDLIVYGKVDDKTMLELLKKRKLQPWEHLHRARANVS